MAGRQLSSADARIWDLHMQGFAPSQIASLAGTSSEHARAVVVGAWFDDKQAAKAAKQSRAA